MKNKKYSFLANYIVFGLIAVYNLAQIPISPIPAWHYISAGFCVAVMAMNIKLSDEEN